VYGDRGIQGSLPTQEERGIASYFIQRAGDWGGPEVEPVQPPLALDSRDRAILDEALLRGAQLSEIVGLMSARALSASGTVLPPTFRLPKPAPSSSRRRVDPRFSLEDAYFLDDRDLTDVQQRRLGQVEATVTARRSEYLEFVRKEFNSLLSPFARQQFTPITKEAHADPYGTAEEKYRALRGAYYCAGFPFVARDFLNLIAPTTFFGAKIPTGVHHELSLVLKRVEFEFHQVRPELERKLVAMNMIIGGFVPRMQEGSSVLSQHAYGLAIDIDASWNPQVKKGQAGKDAVKAFLQATRERLDVEFNKESSVEEVRRIFERMKRISDKLVKWLGIQFPRYDQLRDEMSKVAKDATQKKKYDELQKKLEGDPDLAALVTLIRVYGEGVVREWQRTGIISIPPELIETFRRLGRGNRARSGLEYESSKDGMHLELLDLAEEKSLARPGGPGRRRAVSARLEDLYAPRAEASPVSDPW
jgi:hypothetical protein